MQPVEYPVAAEEDVQEHPREHTSYMYCSPLIATVGSLRKHLSNTTLRV